MQNMDLDLMIEVDQDNALKQETSIVQIKAEIKDEPNDSFDKDIAWPRENYYIKCEPNEESNLVICETCGRIFGDSNKLDEHLQASPACTENVKKYNDANQCEDQRVPVDSEGPEQSIKITLRSNQRQFICEVCKMSFKKADDILKHLRVHFAKKKCNKSIRKNNDLVIHKRTHTENKPLSCEISDKTITNSEFLAIMKELTSFKTEQTHQSKLLSNMDRLLEQKCEESLDIKSSWFKSFGFDFPLSDANTLYELEKKLVTYPELKTKFCSPMTLLMDADDSLQRNMNAVIKKIISRDLALRFTATRKKGDKMVFSLYVPNMFRCIIDTLSACLRKSESKVISAIGTTFAHSQHWGGNHIKISTKKDVEPIDNSYDETDTTGNYVRNNGECGFKKKRRI